MAFARCIFTALGCVIALCRADSPYSEYILTPRSRTLVPRDVYNVNGTVDNAAGLTSSTGVATFSGASAVTYDFGKNIAGIVSFSTGAVDGSGEFIGISFTESSLWISSEGCDATGNVGIDEALWFPVASDGTYRADNSHQRGGFRYLNVYHNTSGSAEVSNLTVYFTAVPQVAEADLGVYSGYFHSSDDQLNRVWYAGAYTTELCTIEPSAGNALVTLDIDSTTVPLPWYNNYTITNGTSSLVDGAKRDRLVWPGDMSIGIPTIAVSTYEMDTIRYSLDSLLVLQNKTTGALPYSGSPLAEEQPTFSFTYHLYTLIGIYNYYLWSGNTTYVTTNWPAFKLAVSYSLSFVDSSGLAYVTSSADWLRFGMGAHNIEANAILYHTLNLAGTLAAVAGDDSAAAASWPTYAANIKSAAAARLWDAGENLFRDNDTLPLTTLHPQDGNSWAVVANLTTSPEQAANISAALASRWGPYGAPAPEAGATVSPFISGFELQAHYLAGRAERAVALVKTMWADFMLDDPRMTNSTFIEGYSTDGSLHYAPYSDDARISYAHGWATGPTSALTAYGAGLQVVGPAGRVWRLAPSLGDVAGGVMQAGFRTVLGEFAASVRAEGHDGGLTIELNTPAGTTGSVSVEAPAAGGTMRILCGGNTTVVDIAAAAAASGSNLARVEVDGLAGGAYSITVVAK